MDVNTLLPDPKAVRLLLVQPSADSITLVVKTIAETPLCPCCQSPSSRIHSRYVRTLADLPWHGIAIRLQLHTRKFFCQNHDCPRRIFCERLPGVVATYGRHTERALQSRSSSLRQAASAIRQAQINSSPAVIEVGPVTMLSSRDGREGVESRKQRYARYKKVMRMYRRGDSIRSIGKVWSKKER
jgi:transposase